MLTEPGAEAPQSASVLPDPNENLATYRAQREGKLAVAQPAPAKTEDDETPDAPASSEQADESAADSEPAEATEQDKPKGKGGFQRKISKLTRERDHWKTLAEQKAAGTGGGAPASEPAESQRVEATQPAPAAAQSTFAKPKPKLEDFSSLEEFTESLTDWKFERKAHDDHAAAQERQAREASDRVTETWNTRKAAAQKLHDDFDEVLESVSDIGLTQPQQFALLESEHGPEIAYQLAQNPKELKRLATLSPLAFAREIGRREALLMGEPEAPETETSEVSKAPPPMRPVGARARATAGGMDLSKPFTLADYRRARESGRLR